MLYLLGNCQAEFAGRILKERGYDCTIRTLASPLTYTSHPGSIPAKLKRLSEEMSLGPYFEDRPLIDQFAPVDANHPPALIILNLFHETTPLFIHEKDQFIFYMDIRALNLRPGLMLWAQKNCAMFNPNPTSYMKRFGELVTQLRHDYPAAPIVIMSRLSHYPAFGPAPFSYLEGWENIWPEAKQQIESWCTERENVHHIDADRVFAGIWSDTPVIEKHCPFLKLTIEEQEGRVTGLHARRDLEHAGPLPARIAQKIESLLSSGEITYTAEESVPDSWQKDWTPSPMQPQDMLDHLLSGANYRAAEAVSAFFLDFSRDYTDLLVRARNHMPICHNTLHMIRVYSRITRNKAMLVWCDAHLKTAAAFTANGLIFQQKYIEKLHELQEYLTALP